VLKRLVNNAGYKARHVPLNRTVAVKMIISGANASDDQLRRFQREAEAAAHLKHSNIVSVYEVGLHNGLPYFSLEFVEGQSLSDLMR
jgi:serine/threonine-protein kinase